jgi:hypothetical protein
MVLVSGLTNVLQVEDETGQPSYTVNNAARHTAKPIVLAPLLETLTWHVKKEKNVNYLRHLWLAFASRLVHVAASAETFSTVCASGRFIHYNCAILTASSKTPAKGATTRLSKVQAEPHVIKVLRTELARFAPRGLFPGGEWCRVWGETASSAG